MRLTWYSRGWIRQTHILFDKWVLWAHLPHDTDWSIKSYKLDYEYCYTRRNGFAL